MRSSVPIQISRFVDEHFPGFIECVLVDAFGKSHVFIEKVPVITTENLLPTSTYPTAGTLDCEIVAEWTDDSGRSLMRIDTERPWGVESTEGLTQFVVAILDAAPARMCSITTWRPGSSGTATAVKDSGIEHVDDADPEACKGGLKLR